jgi:tetratricopeptide (TPR) repeat protein
VLELIPLDDEEAQLATHFALVDLLRQAGSLEAAVAQLERVRRDHPTHAPALEMLAELHTVRGDWTTATRYLYQLVPLAPTPSLRADRLYRLGEAVLVHLGDIDRADDVFLRASDLDPNHLPTLRRLIDVYWRADDPGALVEVATELAAKDALVKGPANGATLAHALVAAALVGDTPLAERLGIALGDDAPKHVASALAELAGNPDGEPRRLELQSASTAIAELGRRGLLDMQKIRAYAAGTPVANVLI